jgi:hypothetical protein
LDVLKDIFVSFGAILKRMILPGRGNTDGTNLMCSKLISLMIENKYFIATEQFTEHFCGG